MDQLYYRSTIKKCTNSHSEINSSLIKFPVIREISKKRSLLISIRTVNIMAIQPLFAKNRRDVIFIQKITQPYNITVEPVELVRVTNTLYALIVLKIM
jgi:hypothetical protein